MKVQLRKPFFPPTSISKINTEIGRVLRNGRLVLGEHLKRFEAEFAQFVGTKYACAVSSGTAGLHLSLLSLGIGHGDEVIVPAKTFISTAHAAMYCNATPVFCDVDEETFLIDPSKFKKLITKKTKAVIPVHVGGNMCAMDEIMEIAKKHKMAVIEDAAHAHGSEFRKKKAGSIGTAGVFSFYPDKIMASSDGGIITTNDKNIYEKLDLLRNVGRRNLGNYEFSIIGYNYRMNEIQAIIAREQLRLLPKMIKRRKEIVSIYDSELNGIKILRKQKIESDVVPVYYAYILRLVKGNLEKFRTALLKKGVETSPIFTSLHKTKPYVDVFGKRDGLCPISEELDSQTFTIPLHPAMTDKKIHYVIKTIKNLVKEY
ncbi:MAG: DegT/DnrJ/EryC1/StrS family aminotransferase [Nitrosotalea sp.]